MSFCYILIQIKSFISISIYFNLPANERVIFNVAPVLVEKAQVCQLLAGIPLIIESSVFVKGPNPSDLSKNCSGERIFSLPLASKTT